MERTRNSRLKLENFNCDFDLESAWLSYGFCNSLIEPNRVLHLVALSRTSDQSLMKILPGVKEILRGHEIQCSNSRPSVGPLDLDCGIAWLGSAHHLIETNILLKFNEKPSRGRDMEWTRNSRLKVVTRDLQL